MNLDMETARLAVHEAGHAIVGRIQGFLIKRIHLNGDEGGYVDYDRGPRGYWPNMVACAAGPVAESMFLGTDEPDFERHTGDYAKLLSIRRCHGFDEAEDDRQIELACNAAKRLLSEEGVFEWVCDLAQRLVDNDGEIVLVNEQRHVSKGFERLQAAAAEVWASGEEYP